MGGGHDVYAIAGPDGPRTGQTESGEDLLPASEGDVVVAGVRSWQPRSAGYVHAKVHRYVHTGILWVPVSVHIRMSGHCVAFPWTYRVP